MGSKYASAFYPQMSMKMQLLNKLSEVLNKFVSILFLKKIVVLKDAFYSNPISHFKHVQRMSFWGNLQIFRRVPLLSHCF